MRKYVTDLWVVMMLGVLVLPLAAGGGTPQDYSKAFDQAIYNQVKKGVLTGRSFDEILPILDHKGWLGSGAQGEHNLATAETFYDALTKNPLPPPTDRLERPSPPSSNRGPLGDVDESEPNDDTGSADGIVLGDTGHGTIDPAGDVDFWRIDVTEATGVVLSCLTPDSDLDPQLTLLDVSSIELAFDDDDGPEFDARLATYVPPGTYFILVKGYSDASTGAYDLVTAGAGVQSIAAREFVGAEISVPGEVLFYAFDVPEESDFDLRSQTLGSGLDSKLRLSDATGRVVTEDDDAGPGNDAWLRSTGGAGMYVISVDSFDGQGTGSFFLQNLSNPAAAPNGAESEPNDDFNTPDPASCCDVLAGIVDPSEDQDFYFLSLAIDTGLTLTVNTPDSDLDPQIYLYDDQQTQIGFDDDGGPGLDSRLEAPLHSGDYYVKVKGFGSSTGSYDLTVICAGLFLPVTTESEPNDDFAGAGSIASGDDLAGTIDPPGDQDYFLLEAKTGLQLDILVNTNASGLDPQLHIFDDELHELYFDDDGGAGFDSALRGIFLAEGSYYVEVNGFANSVGAYQLIIDASYTRPGPVSGGGTTAFFLRARNRDKFFILVGTTEGRTETRFGNQLIAPVQFVLISEIPPCGTLAVNVAVPPDLSGQFFLSQALAGNIPYGGAMFTNLLRVDIQ